MRTGFDLVAFLIVLTPGIGLLAWGVVRAISKPSLRAIDRWAARYGVTVTDVNRSVISRYRQGTRVLQLVGAGAGYLASVLLAQATGLAIPLFWTGILTLIAGYFLGTVIAESIVVRPSQPGVGVRSASLAERALTDYVPAVTVWALRLLPIVMIALAIVYTVMPRLPQNPGDPSLALVAGVTLVLCAVAVVVEQLLRRIVARPQPAIAPDLVAADDAIRASAVHALSGATVGMLLVGIASACFWLQYATPSDALRLPLGLAGTLVILLALAGWIGLGHPRSWRVRHAAPVGA